MNARWCGTSKGPDATPLWTVVTYSFDFESSTLVPHASGGGHAIWAEMVAERTDITFDRDVAGCAVQVTSRSEPRMAVAQPVGNKVQVRLYEGGVVKPAAFSLSVSC
jgi:hypothetical protein